MLRESAPSSELSAREKILIARGAAPGGGALRLEMLVALATDLDAEIRQAAQETLRGISDEQCIELLASPTIDSATSRYFLEPEHLRPAILPALLKHPASPPEAIAALALQANRDLIPLLLAHLEDLKTSALLALKQNPAYLELQEKSVAPGLDRASATRAEAEHSVTCERLQQLVVDACGNDPAARSAARETLQHLGDGQCTEVLTTTPLDPRVPRYFLEEAQNRPALLPLLLSHPDTPQDAIAALAATAGPDLVTVLLDQIDLLQTPALVALKSNPTYLLWQKSPPPQGYVLEVDLLDLLIQEMESDHPPTEEEVQKVLKDLSDVVAEDPDKGSVVHRIARMKVAQRVKLALLGTREERSLLIRDPSRVVFRAVLSSPKLSDSEVEKFSAMKNVSQEVLRLISMKRKFIKSYSVVRCLANNPRTPLDVSLPLLNRLIPNDVRLVAVSKDVPDTLSKMAKKLLVVREKG